MSKARGNHILHLDMDAFFASVEQLDHPEWRGLPVIVGAPPDQRGVVSTCSYEARRYGVHSAMPSRTAFRLCPQGVFVTGRYERYSELSGKILALLLSVTPRVQAASIDEAFLDIAEIHGSASDPAEVARDLKRRIKREIGLTASVGVASNMFLAKLASDWQKPDGLTVMPTEQNAVEKFLAPLPVSRIWGVGPKTAQELAKYGLRQIGDLQRLSAATLAQILGKASGENLKSLAHGRDQRQVQADEPQEKSISREETFNLDCQDQILLHATLWRLTEAVGQRLRQAGLRAGTAVVKLRYSNFRTVSHQMPIQPCSQADRVLLRCAEELWSRFEIDQPIRLIGFGVSKLCSTEQEGVTEPRQLLLFETSAAAADVSDLEAQRDACLDQAVDRLRRELGADILRRGWWPPAAEK